MEKGNILSTHSLLFPFVFLLSFSEQCSRCVCTLLCGCVAKGREISNFRKKSSSFSKHLLSVCHMPGTLINPEETPGTVVPTVEFLL